MRKYSYKIHNRSFKPYYKWITFNTHPDDYITLSTSEVLNLIINGLPSIQKIKKDFEYLMKLVLNLIINGLPSIL